MVFHNARDEGVDTDDDPEEREVYRWIRGLETGFLGSMMAGWVDVGGAVVSEAGCGVSVASVDILSVLMICTHGLSCGCQRMSKGNFRHVI